VTSVPFDTLKLATKLEQTGFTPEQAKGAAAAFGDAFADDRLATKDDLSKLDMSLRAEIHTTLADAKAEILKWMFGTIGFQTVVILGAVFALSRFGH
jgi:hypothetical protein